MKIGIIQFPGSNCERETSLAIMRAGMEPVQFLWNHEPDDLKAMQGFIIVGGFSYEDRSRAGIIAAQSTIIEAIREQAKLGKPILGICNGAQILVESSLVPNLGCKIALTDNKRVKKGQILGTGYYNDWVYINKAPNSASSAFTKNIEKDKPLCIPIAHAEGRFIIPDSIKNKVKQGLTTFQYCDAKAQVLDEFPVNPNGSWHNIAGISNEEGNILALMPHPERTPNGDAIFLSMRDYIQERQKKAHTLNVRNSTTSNKIKYYKTKTTYKKIAVELIITDNTAFSVETAFREKGVDVSIKRQQLWEINSDTEAKFIEASALLYNPQKEFITPISDNNYDVSFLVKAKEDIKAEEKLQKLKRHFGLTGINNIEHGVLWRIRINSGNKKDVVEQILGSNILANSVSHECYYYE